MLRRPLTAAAIVSVLTAVFITLFSPELIYPETDQKDKETVNYECRILSIEEKGGSFNIVARKGRYRLLLTAAADQAGICDLRIGNTISGEFSLSAWKNARNRGNFDEEKYYRSLGIYLRYTVKKIIITDHSYSPGSELLRAFRSRLIDTIEENADDKGAGVICAVLTGYRSGLDEETKDLIQLGGLSHIIAISGLHISFVGMGLFRFLRRKIKRIPASCLSMAAVIAYCVMSGGSASAVRACIMIAVRLGSEIAGRKNDMLSSVSLAMILLLASNPFYITNTGFILSFSAVLAIALFSGEIQEFIYPGSAGKLKKISAAREDISTRDKMTIRIISASAASLSVSVCMMPLISSIWYEYPVYSPLLNIPVLSLMPYILGSALAGGIGGMLFRPLGRFLIAPSVYLVRAVLWLCGLFSGLPSGCIVTGHRSTLNLLIYYALAAAAYVILKVSNRRPGKSSGIFSIVCRSAAVIGFYVALVVLVSFKTHPSGLDISFIDVDQGECILMKTDTGNVYIFDAGSTTVKNVYDRRIESAMLYQGIDRIDCAVITHPDTDHISGLIEMLEDESGLIDIDTILIPDFRGNENYETVKELAERKGIDVKNIYSGMVIKDGKTILRCVHPFIDEEYKDTNTKSAVIYITYEGFSALVTGDISADQELEIIRSNVLSGPLSVLDAAHHGSRESSCREFISALIPETAVISSGVNNIYGHPHKETILRLEEAGSDILNTAELGEIDISVNRNGNYTVSCALN